MNVSQSHRNLARLIAAVGLCAAQTGAYAQQIYQTRPMRLIVPSALGRCPGSRRGGCGWGGDGAMPPGLWQSALRRIAVALIAGASIFTLSAVAQPYPSKPIRIIVPSAPGGGTDISARLIAPKLSEYLGQQVVVENRAGASMMIGGEAVARAAPDGYTLLMGISTLTINPSIQKKMPYDAIRDFAPISLVVTLSNVLASHPALPIRNLKELIDFARTRPGQLTFGSAGVGSNPHLCMELFLHMSELRAVHVPYKGSGLALVDLVAGQIALMMPAVLSGLPHIKAGRLRAYGVTSAQRASGAPDIPTIAEAGVPGYEALQWFGVLAPAGTPREIIAKLHAGVVRALHEADVRKRFLEDGSEPVGSSPEEFAALIRDDTAKWAKVIKDAGIKPE